MTRTGLFIITIATALAIDRFAACQRPRRRRRARGEHITVRVH
jgi:hypothetical protein